ncbi:c-type cytochrome [Rhodanobacter thiooxydans]|uniref:c-type cytochrome n=1 Tax=Rhodanobacter thiooxydans TaxID=416169 RepID=UPI001F1A2995|nr:c-type cytochrome [Rhodanobacter thiooxydans]MCW0201126.1 c-type cytochrome [Rhodanobacter thiooxydans]
MIFGASLVLCAAASGATTPDAAHIVAAGNGHGAPPCASCHGADGGGQAAAGFPLLAHHDTAYLRRQLDSFADGSRANTTMAPIAKSLTAAERQALATYYARMPLPAATQRPAADSNTDRARGEQLATRGMWDQQVPGCVQCHGPHGVGVGTNFPPLAGQSAVYIANQLRDWRSGTRKNEPLGLMQHVASALSDADIQAVSAWFAAQPAGDQGGKP